MMCIEEIRLERITDPADARYSAAMELDAVSFPFHERREAAVQHEIMRHADYLFRLIYIGECFAGLLLCWETDSFLYIEHFCIRPELRSRRYGQRTLELLQKSGKSIILEIDPPVDEMTRRRKAFYERCGFLDNPFRHMHLPYHAGYPSYALETMTSPGRLSREAYEKFAEYQNRVIMANERA